MTNSSVLVEQRWVGYSIKAKRMQNTKVRNSMMGALVFYLCTTVSSHNQQPKTPLIYQLTALVAQESGDGLPGFLASESQSYQQALQFHQKLDQGKIHFQTHSSFWQNSFICCYRTEDTRSGLAVSGGGLPFLEAYPLLNHMGSPNRLLTLSCQQERGSPHKMGVQFLCNVITCI